MRRLPLLFILLGLIWLRLHQPPNTLDDAYITFRYATNLLNGNGFVYNAGERVLGTTTPAYALFLTLSSFLSGWRDFPQLAVYLNTLLDCVTVTLVVRLTTRLSGSWWAGLCAAVLFTFSGQLLDFSTAGMEASFNLCVVFTTLTLLVEGHTRWAALALGVAALIRPDGFMLATAFFAVLALPHLRQPRKWPWAELGIFLATIAPWYLFATLYYGQPIPQSILAKSKLYRTPELMAFRAFLVQLRTVFPFSLPPLQDPEPLWRQIVQTFFPLGLALTGLIGAARRHWRVWVIAGYIALFIAFYSIGNPLWLGWYEIPLMPLYQILILCAVVWGCNALAQRWPAFKNGFALIALPVALVTLALPHLSRLNLLPWETPQRQPFVLNPAFNKRREFDYRLLGRMLQPAAAQGRLVAMPEVGAFTSTYLQDPRTTAKVFDISGLISPGAMAYYPIPADIPFEIYSVPRPMIFELQPDLFITFDSFIQATLPPDDPEFLELYQPTIGLTSHAAFGLQRLMVYRRHDLPVEVSLPATAKPLGVRFGDELTLAGYEVLFTGTLQDQFVDVILYWQNGDQTPTQEFLARVNLVSPSGEVVYQILNYPGEVYPDLGTPLFPTASWTPGMWLVDRYQLKRPQPDLAAYQVTLTLFTTTSDFPVPAHNADGTPLPDDTLTLPELITIPAEPLK